MVFILPCMLNLKIVFPSLYKPLYVMIVYMLWFVKLCKSFAEKKNLEGEAQHDKLSILDKIHKPFDSLERVILRWTMTHSSHKNYKT